MGIDRLDYTNADVSSFGDLSEGAKAFIGSVSKDTGVFVRWVGTGFGTYDALEVPATVQL